MRRWGHALLGGVLAIGGSSVAGDPPTAAEPVECTQCAELFSGKSMTATPRIWASADYLLWWVKDAPVSIPVVSGNLDNPDAALDERGSVIVYGARDQDLGAFSGGRFGVGGWLDPCSRLGVEVSGLLFEQRTAAFGFGPSDRPNLGLPFINALDGDPEAFPIGREDMFVATVDVSNSLRMWGIEANALYNLFRRGSSEGNALIGFRYFDLDERFEEMVNSPGIGEADGNNFNSLDSIQTRNQFYGCNLGGQWRWQRGWVMVDVLGKVALGSVQQRQNVLGVYEFSLARPPEGAGGFYTQRTNIGGSSSSDFAVLPEIGANFGLRLTDGITARVGYSFLYLSDVIRPGDQLDPVLNPTQTNGGILRGAARPARLFEQDSIYAHGINFGLEVRF